MKASVMITMTAMLAGNAWAATISDGQKHDMQFTRIPEKSMVGSPAFHFLNRDFTDNGHPQHAVNPHIVENYGKLPLSFEANWGQTDSQVKFISRGSGYSLFLTSAEAVLSLQEPPAGKGALPSASVLKLKLVGENPSPQLVGQDELPGKSNYFSGNDPTKWHTDVPIYAKVKYADVYPGIDLVYYGNHRQLEYDFVISPGTDARAIRIAIDGDKTRRIDGQGDLVLETAGGSELRLHQPVIYQEVNGTRQHIGGSFVMQGRRQVGFEVAPYDASKPLIIDPVLSYSTYLDAPGYNYGTGIAVDSSGNAYITGITRSVDFPTANAFQAGPGNYADDVFVTKFNATGSALVYSTYLVKETFNGANDFPPAIAVDSSGNAYVTGSTGVVGPSRVVLPGFSTANAFQATNAGWGDAFVTKLDAAGSALVYSTYLGGSDLDYANGIAVDSSGDAYVTGVTYSTNFPTANAFQAKFGGGPHERNAFVTKLNADGSALVYSTYLGGGYTDGYGIAVDSSTNAYVTGQSSSTSFPTTAGAFQTTGSGCFITKFNSAGTALAYSTFVNNAWCAAIAVDSSGNAYVTGAGGTANFSTANAFQAMAAGGGDAFVMKLNAAGSAPVYSTYLGGSGQDWGNGIAVDSSGNAYITGFTYSTNFPTANAFQTKFGGGDSDAFVTKLNFDGSALVYSTYLGGSGADGFNGCDGCAITPGIAVDASGSAYLTGWTNSTNFPQANAFQAAIGGIFVTKFAAVPDPWQQAIDAMKTAAGTDSFNFWQWAWYWQRSPAFPGSPAGFGVLGSIDNTPGLIDEIIAAGGGNGPQNISAEQWVLYYRNVKATDPWQQALARMQDLAGTNGLNFWQWAWYWQRSPTFAGAPAGFGVLGSIDNPPGAIGKIIAAGGGNGFSVVSAQQWILYYRQAASQ